MRFTHKQKNSVFRAAINGYSGSLAIWYAPIGVSIHHTTIMTLKREELINIHGEKEMQWPHQFYTFNPIDSAWFKIHIQIAILSKKTVRFLKKKTSSFNMFSYIFSLFLIRNLLECFDQACAKVYPGPHYLKCKQSRIIIILGWESPLIEFKLFHEIARPNRGNCRLNLLIVSNCSECFVLLRQNSDK